MYIALPPWWRQTFDTSLVAGDPLSQVPCQILLFLYWSSWHVPARVVVHCQRRILFLRTLACATQGASDTSSPSHNKGVTPTP